MECFTVISTSGCKHLQLQERSKAQFKRRAFVVPNLIVCIWYIKSSTSESIKFGKPEFGATRHWARPCQSRRTAKVRHWFKRRALLVPNQMHTLKSMREISGMSYGQCELARRLNKSRTYSNWVNPNRQLGSARRKRNVWTGAEWLKDLPSAFILKVNCTQT